MIIKSFNGAKRIVWNLVQETYIEEIIPHIIDLEKE